LLQQEKGARSAARPEPALRRRRGTADDRATCGVSRRHQTAAVTGSGLRLAPRRKPLTGCAVVHERSTSPSYMQLERKKNDLYSTHQLPLLLSFFFFNRAIFFRVLAPDFYRPYALPVI